MKKYNIFNKRNLLFLGLTMGVFCASAQNCANLYPKGTNAEGCLRLEWSTAGLNSNNSYGFTFYQYDDSVHNWQTTSSNYCKTIKVLNVYPDTSLSNTLKTWMDDPAVGFGQILVTPVTITAFNANPDSFLKNGNGEYIYDVVMFGSFDRNNRIDLNPTSAAAVRNFINSGRGVLFGHDTQRGDSGNPNFRSLTDLSNLEQNNPSSPFTNRGGSIVEVVNNGFLLKYPHHIPYHSILNIPCAHSTAHGAKGVVWIKFSDTLTCGGFPDLTEVIVNGGTNNFYLTTWNNTAVIQTGHTGGQSTQDERKIIANTLWYLAQFTTDTTGCFCSARDVVAPDTATVIRETCRRIKLRSEDNGSSYQMYLKATNLINYNDTCLSNVLSIVAKSGLKGFYVSEDNSANGVPNISTAVFVAGTDNLWANYAVSDIRKYIHIQAMDSVGNLSAVVTLPPDPLCLESDTLCAEDSIRLVADINPSNLTYDLQWFVNDTAYLGATDTLFEYAPNDGDMVFCRLIPSGHCIDTTTQYSAVYLFTVKLRPVFSVRDSSNKNDVCTETEVTFTAIPTNGGIPTYQWLVNGDTIVGATNPTFTYPPEDGDLVQCIVTSSLDCATPNPITTTGTTMIINAKGTPTISIRRKTD